MKWEHLAGIVGFTVVAGAHAWGLLAAPSEAAMGETGRLLYLHVPTAWAGMGAFLVAFVAAVGVLWAGSRAWDALLEASVEVGILMSVLLCIQGALWARPTWGWYWTWDPRLTTTAVMVVAFVGVLVLRKLVHRPDRRAVTSAVATIASFVDVPVVYLSVKWWRSQHQPISNADTVDAIMLLPFFVACFGMLFVTAALIGGRSRIARASLDAEDRATDLPDKPAPLHLEATP